MIKLWSVWPNILTGVISNLAGVVKIIQFNSDVISPAYFVITYTNTES